MLAVRQDWSEKNPDVVAALVRAHIRASEFIEEPQNRAEAARILRAPERIGVDAEVIQRTLDGRLKISPDGAMRESGRYLLVGREGAGRPDPAQAAWLYAQMVRWGQTAMKPDALKTAMANAADALTKACPSTMLATPTARLDAMSMRLETMLSSVRSVRGALADFYGSLSDEQKAQFNLIGRQQSAKQS